MIEQAGDQTHQGYSAVLDLHLRWEQGELGRYDPATGRHIVRFDDEREARLAAEARADTADNPDYFTSSALPLFDDSRRPSPATSATVLTWAMPSFRGRQLAV